MTVVQVGDRLVGEGQPVFIIAEIGINHNGSPDMARQLIDGARFAGCDAVKFQKRTPVLCVPYEQWHVMRDTPWGRMSYIDYRHRLEFGTSEFKAIDNHCRESGLLWFASCWDEGGVEFMETFNPPLYKAASASLTDHGLLRRMKATGKPLILSTGMSTMEEIEAAVAAAGEDNLLLAHSTSAYPCRPAELNLRMIHTLRERFPAIPVGYSGHELGLATTWAAVALGATFVERHISIDRTLWGSDQVASLEVLEMQQLVREIRTIEKALGDGVKRVYVSEREALRRLRRQGGALRPLAEPSGDPAFSANGSALKER